MSTHTDPWGQVQRDIAVLKDEVQKLLTEVDKVKAERDAAINDLAHAIDIGTKALKDRDQWKANHDNAVEIKRAVLDRPDLKDRATSVLRLFEQRDALRKYARHLPTCPVYAGHQLTCDCGFAAIAFPTA